VKTRRALAIRRREWTRDAGNSPLPRAGPLPSYMAVALASDLMQDGSTISRDCSSGPLSDHNPTKED